MKRILLLVNMYKEINKPAFEYNKAVHPILTSICSSLFSNLNIKHLRYMRIFYDCSYLALGTNLEYAQFYLEKINNPGKIFTNPLIIPQYRKFSYFLWPSNLPKEEKDPLLNALYDFNIWNGISICRRQENYVETWSFASSKDNPLINQFYINNLHLLEYFVSYFESKASGLINGLSPDKLAVFQHPFDLSYLPKDIPTENNINTFLNENKIIKYSIKSKDINACLSHRELECLLYISMGKNSKKIGELLNISVRTVESYINSIKIKTGIHFKSDLVDIIPIDELLFLKYALENKIK